MVTIKINGAEHHCEAGTTVLEAAGDLGIKIPTLCHNDFLKPYGGCRLCLVEQVGRPALTPACTTVVSEGLEINTESDRISNSRKFVIELLLSRCPNSEQIQKMAKELGVQYDNPDSLDVVGKYLLNRAPKRVVTDCVLCGLCVRACQEVPQRFALSISERGISRTIKPPFGKSAESCIGCGACAYVCPTKTITIEEVS
ncbi:MAG: 4Fe-4S dicluster domain-containing protein [Spirochaetales bacterium]|jgi:bidirectional [NiFe] hydrogenase diaphorase subunit|nr:4Fe-4S dicluster domain-containing protein [Spirochaetales bacterium]